jgi:hypothetical protein
MNKKTLFKSLKKLPGSGNDVADEEPLEDVKFEVHKLNQRQRPKDKNQILAICCFSEFGCETLGVMYCLPRIMRDYPDKYKIVIGWHGRKYLYKHLADEFWEMKPEHMWLREYARAFHHESRNLDALEDKLKSFGVLVPSSYMGKVAVSAKCFSCGLFWSCVWSNGNYEGSACPRCGKSDVLWPLLNDVSYWKKKVVRIPDPSPEKINFARQYISGRPVGIFARARKCYGRNLQPEFYKGLILLLREMGFEPIWLGEKVSTIPCPVDDVVDFSRMDEARDLETTLALIKNCEFTIQFWTASSRLAGMMGVPYLLFESPDQIWGKGQEGIRRNLCDFGPRKLSINHYLNVYNNNDLGLDIVRTCIKEMMEGNWEDHMGLVDHEVVTKMRMDNKARIGG